MNWPTATLRQIAPPSAADIRFKPDERVWSLSLDQIESETGAVLEKRYVQAEEAGTSTFNFDTGNVLYSKLRPYLNKVLVPNEPGIATTELIPLRPRKDVVDARFLAHYLRSQRFVNEASHHVAGANLPRVIMDWFWKHEAPLPPLSEQRRIVELLDEADRLRRLRRDADTKAARILPALFLKIFGDPATNPMGWPKAPLLKLGKVQTGSTPPSSEEGMFGGVTPFVTPGDLGGILVESKRTLSASGAARSRIASAGSVLVCCIGATIGKMGVATQDSAFNQQINAVSWSEKVVPFYGFHVMQFLASEVAARGTSTTLPILKKSEFEKIEIPVPPLELQNRFGDFAHSITTQRSMLEAAAGGVEDMFSALLRQAFSGQLTVNWRQARMQDLLAEMQQQAKALNLPLPKDAAA